MSVTLAVKRRLPAAIIAVALFSGSLLVGLRAADQTDQPTTSTTATIQTPNPQAEPAGATPLPQPSWPQLIGLALGSGFLGGIFGELWRALLEWLRRRSEAKTRAKDVVDRHLDPVLKSADELLGKLRSLAQEDFHDFRTLPRETKTDLHSFVDLGSVFYLFANFWARLEILRKDGLYVNLNQDPQGKQLTSFLYCLESKRVRVVDRAWQRAIGESLIVPDKEKRDCIPFRDFVERYLSDEEYRVWFKPLRTIMEQIGHTRHRQRLLLYGVIVHALYDTLDPKHMTTKGRPAYPNKLTRRTRKDLRFRVFKVYLPFVRDTHKYIIAEG